MNNLDKTISLMCIIQQQILSLESGYVRVVCSQELVKKETKNGC